MFIVIDLEHQLFYNIAKQIYYEEYEKGYEEARNKYVTKMQKCGYNEEDIKEIFGEDL